MDAPGDDLDPDRALALSYIPAKRRAALAALWRLDLAMGAVLAGGREPLISQIKLTWWRDSLAKLDHAKAPAEPILQGISEHVILAGVSGEELSGMETGWTALLTQEPLSGDDLGTYSKGRGAVLFRSASTILGMEPSSDIERAGEGWALIDLARHSNEVDAAAAFEAARERLSGGEGFRWPSALRPLGMLAALAARDAERGPGMIEPPGAPARMVRMLGHRLTGR